MLQEIVVAVLLTAAPAEGAPSVDQSAATNATGATDATSAAPATQDTSPSEAASESAAETPASPEDPAAVSAAPEDDIALLDLEELLDTPIAAVSASRRAERSSKAAASVFVLTSEDIRRYGHRSVDEVLRTVPGLFVSNESYYPTVGVRGMSLLGDLMTRLLVLVDGHPLNNSVGIGQSYVGRELPIDVGGIERIEVIKGPVGSVYGPVAYFGVVNIVTRRIEGAEVFVAGDYLQNEIRGGEARARAGTTVAGIELNAFASFFRSTGVDYTFPELELAGDRELPESQVLRGTDYHDAESAYATAKWKDLSARVGWSRRVKGLPTAPYSTVIGDPRNRFINRQGYAELGWSRQVSEPLQLQARVSYDDFRYGDDLAYPEPPDDAGLFVDLGTDRWATVEARGTLTPFKNHRDTIGVEMQLHQTLQHSRYVALPSAIEDPEEGFGVGPIPRDFRTVNAYASVEQTFFDQLTLQAGVTFFDHSIFGNRFTPKFAAVWQPTGEDTVKVLYTEGFRPPTMFEAVFEDGLDYIANAALRPETTVSRELIYERRLFGVASITASLYRNSYYNLINATFVPAPEDPESERQQYVNAGSIQTTGGELGVSFRKGDWIQAYGGLSIQNAEFIGELTSNAGFAPITANFALSTRGVWQPLTLSLDGAFVDARLKDQAILLPGVPLRTEPSLRLNATARLDVPAVKGLTVLLSAYNLTDAPLASPLPGDHAPISELPDAGRSLRLGLSYKFQ